MKPYLDLVKHVLDNGILKKNRTGTDTLMSFGYHYKVDLAKGFPLLTTKKVFFNSVIHELLWYLSGETHIRNLRQHTKIWDAWTSEEKNWEIGKMYGYQWVKWEKYIEDQKTGNIRKEYINQVDEALKLIKHNPDSRRIIVSAWNPSVLPDTSISFKENVSKGKAALPPCHAFFQFYVNEGKLSCQLYQRSADIFLGVPFKIDSYSLFTLMIAQVCGYKPGDFIHTFGDAHIYSTHIKFAEEMIKRDSFAYPKLIVNKEYDNIYFFICIGCKK